MKLRIRGIRLEASHAAYDWEQRLGTTIDVDVDVTYARTLRRSKSETLAQVIPVETVVSTVHRISDRKVYRLMENLANDILDALWVKHRGKAAEVVVRLKKIRPTSDRRIAGYEVEVARG